MMLQRKLYICNVVLLVLLSWVSLSPAFVYGQEKKLPFKGYSNLTPQFRSLCDAINEDGRGDFLVQSAAAYAERDIACEACRPLMKTIMQNCKRYAPKVTPTPKGHGHAAAHEDPPAEALPEGEAPPPPTPTPTPTPVPGPNREPSPVAIDRAVRLFTAIAEDKLISEKSIPAIYRLFFILTDPSRTTPGQREYFDILQTYVLPIFEAKKKESGKQQDGSPLEKKKSSEHLQSLFE